LWSEEGAAINASIWREEYEEEGEAAQEVVGVIEGESGMSTEAEEEEEEEEQEVSETGW
jgi:hypothetical protein